MPACPPQRLLQDTKAIIEEADWGQLRLVVSRIEGRPNDARENLGNVVAVIDDLRTAERARLLAAELFE